MQQFKSLPEVIKHFSDEKTCRDYLEQTLWSGKPVCPHCSSATVYRLNDGKTFSITTKIPRKKAK